MRVASFTTLSRIMFGAKEFARILQFSSNAWPLNLAFVVVRVAPDLYEIFSNLDNF